MDQNNAYTRQLEAHDSGLVQTIITVALLASNCGNVPDCQLQTARSFLEVIRTEAAAYGEALPNVDKMLQYLNSYVEPSKVHVKITSTETQNTTQNHFDDKRGCNEC